MSIQALIALLQSHEKHMEDLFIEKEALCWHLRQRGYTVEELKQLCADAKLDPQLREQARTAYAQIRETLETAGREAGIEALSDIPPPSGKSN